MSTPIAPADIASALDCGPSEHIALVGGGGKTTTLFALAHTLPGAVVATTTTRMASNRTDGLPVALDPDNNELVEALHANRAVLVWNERGPRKALGVRPEACDHWFALDAVDHVVVEADGARQRPFTAPHVFEPVIPATTTLVIACIGADALGRVIADQCHRPLRIAAIAECSPYERLTAERAATVLLSDRGSRKLLPPGARFAVAVHAVQPANQAHVDELLGRLQRIDPTVPTVAVAPAAPTPPA